MRSLHLLAPLVLLLACNETGLTPNVDVESPDPDEDDGGGDGDDDPLPTTCVDNLFPAFDAGIDESCERELAVGTFNPVVKWRKRSWSTSPGANWIMSAPIVIQVNDDNRDGVIDGNDIPDVVAVSFSGGTVLRAVSGATGDELWNATTSLQITGSPAAADIDGDGLIDIIGVTSSGIEVYNHDGSLKFTRPGVLAGAIHGTSDAVSVTDMDGDGLVEIIVGRAILDHNGNLVGRGTQGMGGVQAFGNVGSTAFAVDLDGDGQQEVVVGNALYRKDGSTIWANGRGDGYPAVGDITGNGEPDIVVVGGGRVRLQDRLGTVLWDVALPGTNGTYHGGPPTIADFTGDGRAEIGVASGSRYSVFRADGSIVWQMPTDDSSSGNTGSTVFDFEGDGAAEVVYADQTSLWVFSGADGRVKLQWTEHSNGTWLEYPVVADLDGDEVAEIVVVHTPQYGSTTGMTVIGDRDNTWRRGSPIWNQHAFHITNVNPDGTIPATPERNWLRYNNFRSSDISANTGLAAPDLVAEMADVCELSCADGELWVWTHVGNGGMAPATGVTVSVVAIQGELEVPLDERSYGELEQGVFTASEQWIFGDLNWPTIDRLEFRVRSEEQDCNDNNDVLVVNGPFCL